MKEPLSGRHQEVEQLKRCASSGRAEFIAIYGRRRVGKTFLVNHVFEGQMSFAMTGVMDGNKAVQMRAFADAMELSSGQIIPPPHDWLDAFAILRRYLSQFTQNTQPIIVFIDELPCLDTPKSDFVDALGYFWNSWACRQPQLKLVVCGSATSWMMSNVIDSHGGLHDRVTHEIHLREFRLAEVEQYLQSRGMGYDRMTILQAYMILGGIPHYLSLLEKNLSLAQNIDKLFFAGGELRREFSRLYSTLFSSPDGYVTIINALYDRREGMTREQIALATNRSANGTLTKMLQNLIDCDLVRFYNNKTKRITARGGIYQLTDFFSIFYLHFVKNGSTDKDFWVKSINSPRINSWLGLAFERVCMAHIEELKYALGIGSIRTEYYAWRAAGNAAQGAQIDLVIERADRMANACEMKYAQSNYVMNKSEAQKLQSRIDRFKESTQWKGGIIPTLVTPCGLSQGGHSGMVSCLLTLDDLFVTPQYNHLKFSPT